MSRTYTYERDCTRTRGRAADLLFFGGGFLLAGGSIVAEIHCSVAYTATAPLLSSYTHRCPSRTCTVAPSACGDSSLWIDVTVTDISITPTVMVAEMGPDRQANREIR